MNSADSATSVWLIRIPEVWSDCREEILGGLNAVPIRRLGAYEMVRLPAGRNPRSDPEGILVSWCLALEHVWPCNPAKIEGFVEKASGALARKFAARKPRTVWVGILQDSDGGGWFKRLASNLRGRCLQLFPESAMSLADAGLQDPDEPALYCMVGKEGVFAGMASPREANGFYPGGVLYLPRDAEKHVSRAGSKIAEALHHAALYGRPPGAGSRWLELGASPGGMTMELLKRGCRVTAIDKAALDSRLEGVAGLRFFQQDVREFRVGEDDGFDALLCDMNGEPLDAFAQVLRLATGLKCGAWLFFTLKTMGRDSFASVMALHEEVLNRGEEAGLCHRATSHLGGNRREFTMLWRKE